MFVITNTADWTNVNPSRPISQPAAQHGSGPNYCGLHSWREILDKMVDGLSSANMPCIFPQIYWSSENTKPGSSQLVLDPTWNVYKF